MINFNFGVNCYSCTACSTICKRGAIKFDENLHPIVNIEECVECGQCENVCPEYQLKTVAEAFEGECFIGRTRDEKILKHSSSGGVFYQLAMNMLMKGGYVCGCVFDSNFNTKHVVTNKTQDVLRMLGSKYIASDLSDSFVTIQNIINKGGLVLFSGTPCQTAALRRVVGNTDQLVTIAVVCHGSIEPKIWQKYLLEKCYGKTIKKITMRDKSHGWLNYGLIIEYSDGTTYKGYRNETGYFLQAYVRGLMERERCLNCGYKGSKIIADVLLGDGWGIETVDKDFNDGKGVSDIFCLTPLGLQLLDESQNCLFLKPFNLEYAVSHNPRIVSPAPRNPNIERFREGVNNGERIEMLCKKYIHNSVLYRIRRKIRSIFTKLG